MLELVFPLCCPFCSENVYENGYACHKCKDHVKMYKFREKVFTDDANNDLICVAPYLYDAEVKDAIWRFKFKNRNDLARTFANAMIMTIIEKYAGASFDVVTSVPLYNGDLRRRGYNQAELLAKNISKKLKLKHKRLLSKPIKNLVQHDLDYEDRAKNVKGVYRAENTSDIAYKRILLCDDILTTGNTVNECAKVLKRAGAKDVKCATIAVARKFSVKKGN